MVDFINITTDNNYIYATAKVYMYKEQSEVRIPREKGKPCEIKERVSEDTAYYIRKAAVCLRYELTHKGKLRDRETVA